MYLKSLQLRLGNGVRLGNDRDDIHFGVQLLHANQIQRFESMSYCKVSQISF